jgi:hypothetical protein
MSLVDAVTGVIGKVVDKVAPDAGVREQMKFELDKMDKEELYNLVQGQLDINKIEAASENVFVSGWRPAIGWVGATALFTYYVPYSLTATGIWAYHCIQSGQFVTRPDIGIADLIGLVGTLLGFGVLRSVDKSLGTGSGH